MCNMYLFVRKTVFPCIYAGQTSEVHYYMTLMLTEMDSTPVFLSLVLHLIHNKISNDRTQGVLSIDLFCVLEHRTTLPFL